jgi:hypothetical protein
MKTINESKRYLQRSFAFASSLHSPHSLLWHLFEAVAHYAIAHFLTDNYRLSLKGWI